MIINLISKPQSKKRSKEVLNLIAQSVKAKTASRFSVSNLSFPKMKTVGAVVVLVNANDN